MDESKCQQGEYELSEFDRYDYRQQERESAALERRWESDDEGIQRTEGLMILWVVIELGLGVGLYFVRFPGMEPICRQLNILGLLLMSVAPGLTAALMLLIRRDVCNSPGYDVRQSLAEKTLIFFGIGSVPAVWLAFRLSLALGACLAGLLLVVMILIFMGWFIGNIRRERSNRQSQ